TTYYGFHFDGIGATLTADLNYGVWVEMPAAYGAGAQAAIYATGNANIWSCLAGDGMYIYMREAASIAMNIDVDVAADANNDLDVLTVTHDASNTAAAAATHDGWLINYQMVLANSDGGGSLARTGNLIGIDIDLTETLGAVTYAGPVIDINIARVTAGTPTVQGDIINVYVGQADATQMDTAAELNLLTIGAKLEIQGHTMRGYYLDIDVIMADPAAVFYGNHLDLDDITVTNAATV
ncbi:unnamed protein product, partial [marine sediment metagenome]